MYYMVYDHDKNEKNIQNLLGYHLLAWI